MRCLAFVLLFAAVPCQAQTKLEWLFKDGETVFAERIYTQKQSVEVKNKLFNQERTKTWVTAITVKEKTAAGYVLDLKVESVAFKSTGPPVPGGFDDKMAAKMKGTQFTATINPQGKVLKFEGYDAFIQKLAEKKTEVEKVLRGVLSEEGVREDVEEIFSFLPDKAVQKGDKWKREAVDPVPPFGSFRSVFDYVCEGDDEGLVTIGYSIKMTYKAPSGDGDLFRVVKGGLKGEEGKGTFVFDSKKGRLVSGEKSVQVRGDLVIESMGNQTPMEFTSQNTLRVRLFTKD